MLLSLELAERSTAGQLWSISSVSFHGHPLRPGWLVWCVVRVLTLQDPSEGLLHVVHFCKKWASVHDPCHKTSMRVSCTMPWRQLASKRETKLQSWDHWKYTIFKLFLLLSFSWKWVLVFVVLIKERWFLQWSQRSMLGTSKCRDKAHIARRSGLGGVGDVGGGHPPGLGWRSVRTLQDAATDGDAAAEGARGGGGRETALLGQERGGAGRVGGQTDSDAAAPRPSLENADRG